MDVRQFNREIIQPTLSVLDMDSLAAERLMLGTAVHESNGLRYVRQLNGPALSFFQIEPATARDIINRYLQAPTRRKLLDRFRTSFEFEPRYHSIENRLICDMRFACAVARIKYWMSPEPLPPADNLDAMAVYWGKWYQTQSDPSKITMWKNNYLRFVGTLYP